MDASAVAWALRPSTPEDAGWIAELRAVVLQDDLTRLGRYDPMRVRQRFLDSFAVAGTQVIMVDGADAGSIAVRTEGDVRWIEHFYLDPVAQGRGVGGAVLEGVLSPSADQVFRLNVLQGSPVLRLYLRAGFVVDTEDEVDIFMTRVAPQRA